MKSTAQVNSLFMSKPDRLYEQLLQASSASPLSTQQIKQLIELGAKLHDPMLEITRNQSLIWNIVLCSQDEETAIELLRFIHQRDAKVISQVKPPAPLLYYILNGKCFKLATCLIHELGYGVDTVDDGHRTSLYWLVQNQASIEQLEPKVRFLLAQGADPAQQNIRGISVIQAACSPVIKQLLRDVANGKLQRETLWHDMPIEKSSPKTYQQSASTGHSLKTTLSTLFARFPLARRFVAYYQTIPSEAESSPKPKLH